MTHDLEHLLKKSAPTEALTPSERAQMRAALGEYLGYRPVRTSQPTTSDWTTAFRALVSGRAPAFLSAFLIIAITTGSVASAAEGSLPGDPLYSVKVDLLEPLRISLSSTKQGRIAWERSFAERRLTEAAQLAEQGRLTPDTEAELAATFIHYADLVIETPEPTLLATTEADTAADAGPAQMKTMSLSAPAPEPEPAPTIPADPESEDFSARLAAFESILIHIDETRKSTTTEALRRAIRAQTDKVPEAFDEDSRARRASLREAARREVYTEVTETLETELPADFSLPETASATTTPETTLPDTEPVTE